MITMPRRGKLRIRLGLVPFASEPSVIVNIVCSDDVCVHGFN